MLMPFGVRQVLWYYSSQLHETVLRDTPTAREVGGENIVRVSGEIPRAQAEVTADCELVSRANIGELDSFGELVRRHERAICGVVSRMLDNQDDVDDVVQDVFVTAFRSLSSFRGSAAFSTWLYRIAVNTTIKQMRKARVRQAASIDDPEAGFAERLAASVDCPQEEAERAERAGAVRDAIRDLSEKHKAVVVLHYYENLSCDEIARILGCSVGTVWSRLHYACRKLHGRLQFLASES